jgi:hypothetical protein
MWRRMRRAETDSHARRVAVLENAFDKRRAQVWRECRREVKGRDSKVDNVVGVQIDRERQWLGLGDDSGYGRSGECKAPGLLPITNIPMATTVDPELGQVDANLWQNHTHERRRRSLWRSAYERVSQNNPDREDPRALPSSSKRKSRRSRNAEQRVRVYDDHPPPSILRTYRDNRRASQVLRAQAAQFPGNTMSQNSGLNVQDQHPVLSTQKELVRADTVLHRLFSDPPLRSDGSYSSRSGGTSAISASSQSHRTHLPLNAAPVVLTWSVDSGRPVEVAAGRPTSPVMAAEDACELQVEPVDLPVPPQPVQQLQDGLDQTAAELPPSPPSKDSHMSSHRRESVLHQGIPSASMVVPTPNLVSDRELTPTPYHPEDQSRYSGPSLHELPGPQSPSPPPHRPAASGAYETTFPREVIPSSPSRASMRVEVARPTHTFHPQPSRQPRSKGARRTSVPVNVGTSSLPPRRSVPQSSYTLSYLPDARSPPSSPRADQTLSRHQHS